MQTPSARTWVDGETVTPQLLNEQIRDNFNFFVSPPLAKIYLAGTSTQPWPRTTFTQVLFDAVAYDNDGMALGGNALTIQTAGVYTCTYSIYGDEVTGATNFQIRLLVNGAQFGRTSIAPGGGKVIYSATTPVALVPGDVLTVDIYHNASGDSTYRQGVLTFLSAAWTGGTPT